jgi:hypothetical protein
MKRKKLLNWWSTEPRFIRGVFSAPPRIPLLQYEFYLRRKPTDTEAREAQKGTTDDE